MTPIRTPETALIVEALEAVLADPLLAVPERERLAGHLDHYRAGLGVIEHSAALALAVLFPRRDP